MATFNPIKKTWESPAGTRGNMDDLVLLSSALADTWTPVPHSAVVPVPNTIWVRVAGEIVDVETRWTGQKWEIKSAVNLLDVTVDLHG